MDRTSKIVLAAIAAGLWANLAMFLLQPPSANADDTNYLLRSIDRNLSGIYRGSCFNHKIC